MIRPATLICVVLLFLLAFAVFQVEHSVQALKSEFNDINRQIIASQKTIHVLRAEWTYLNQPERLREMAGKYLRLEKIRPKQVREIEEIPITPYMVKNYRKESAGYVRVNAAPEIRY